MIEVGLPILLRVTSGLVLLWSALHFFGTWITFRIVNFILIIGLGVYLFKTYLADWVTNQIEKRDRELADLNNQKKVLHEQVQVVVQQTMEQDKKIQGVLARIRQWQSRFEQYKAEANEVSTLATKQCIIRNNNQLRALRKKKYNDAIAPLVLQEVRKQLEYDFENKERGRAYLTSIITSLQRDTM